LTPTFTVYAASLSNQSPDRVEQLVKIGIELSPYKDLLYGTPIEDSFTELLSLSRCEKDIPTIVASIHSGKFSRVDDAKKAITEAANVSEIFELAVGEPDANQLEKRQRSHEEDSSTTSIASLSNTVTEQNPSDNKANPGFDEAHSKPLQKSEGPHEPSLADRVKKIEEELKEIDNLPAYLAKQMKETNAFIQDKDMPDLPSAEDLWDLFLSANELLWKMRQRLPVENFSCHKCGSKDFVAVNIKCTDCNTEAWRGRFPRDPSAILIEFPS
jgi:hypothetical protein